MCGWIRPLVAGYLWAMKGAHTAVRVRLLLLGLALVPTVLLAQEVEHPFIGSFELRVLDGSIHVSWTMQGGSTCDGTEVMRSSDGQHFEAVHRMEGICGDAISDLPFAWIDRSPPEFRTVYYRIKLGAEGSSSVKSVNFAQLTAGDQRFFPSPMQERATLVLNVPASARVDLLIVDMAGRVVLEQAGLLGRSHSIELPQARAGMYAYIARSEGRSFQGRFIKAN